MKGMEGEWRDRSRKHRYLMIFDKDLKKRLTWKEEKLLEVCEISIKDGKQQEDQEIRTINK